ncbi:CUB domain [Trinorchestia longiramus]|nr:CUB domain [Trinorchestia longiramus]
MENSDLIFLERMKAAILILAVASCAYGASLEIRLETADCGTHTMAEGERLAIQSPNFPKDYPVDERCQWEISCPSEDDHYLEFVCPTFDLQSSPDCVNDRLVIASRGERDTKCGTDSPDGMTTSTGWTRLTFFSNADKVAQGFRCYIWCRAAPTVPTTTTSTTAATTTAGTTTAATTTAGTTTAATTTAGTTTAATTTAGTTTAATTTAVYELVPNQRVIIQSTNFPKAYANDERCQWEFSCPEETANYLDVICPKFSLEDSTDCTKDKLIVTSRGERDVKCGTDSPDGTQTSTGWARFTYRTDSSGTDTGFRCYIWCRPK